MSEAKDVVVLVLGGTGFIGRNLVKYLVDNNLAKTIVVADKSPPGTAYLSPLHAAAFANKELVNFRQVDLSKPDHVKKAFKDHKFTYVVNLCGETRCGCHDADYKIKCEDTAARCLEEAKVNGITKWIEVSTAQVYEPEKAIKTEKSKLEPWTTIAKYRLKAEALVKASGVPYVILRPAIVYGPGDLTGLSPRIMCAVAYCVLKEKMSFLWTDSLQLNTVHVDDVCQAIWQSCTKANSGAIYNLADSSNLTQGALSDMLGKMFGIDTGFVGTVLSNLAKVNLAGVASDANDKHVPAWAKACEEAKINNTPLSPYIDQELLYKRPLYVDGTLISKELAMPYKHPKCTIDLLTAQVKGFEAQGIFPPNFLKAPK